MQCVYEHNTSAPFSPTRHEILDSYSQRLKVMMVYKPKIYFTKIGVLKHS